MIIYAYQIISCLLVFVRRLFYALHLKLTCIIEREIGKSTVLLLPVHFYFGFYKLRVSKG